MSQPLTISFGDISAYCQKSIRPIEEGFLLCDSPSICQVACVRRTGKTVKYAASIIQTSDHNAKPHTVEVWVEWINEKGEPVKKLDGKCSCKANIKKCKHIVALMLKLMNENPKRMDVLSRTDVTQNWGRYASLSLEEFTAKPVEEMKCCYKDKVSRVPATVEYSERVDNLLRAFPNSALALALKPTDQQIQSTAVSINTDSSTSISYDNIFPDTQKNSGSQFKLVGPKDIVSFYYKYVYVEFDEANCIFEKSRGQASLYWKLQRKIRITCSVAHALYTYASKPREEKLWLKKLNSIIFNSFKGNKYTKFGSRNERNAINILKEGAAPNERINTNCGLVVNCETPWFACSPDGFLENEHDRILLEVKCPYKGIHIKRVKKFLKSLTFLYFDKKSKAYRLKTRNAYFTQIQLALHLTNLRFAKLVIYHKFTKSVICIDVEKDIEYCEMISRLLSLTYVTHMLPYLAKNRRYFEKLLHWETARDMTKTKKLINKIKHR